MTLRHEVMATNEGTLVTINLLPGVTSTVEDHPHPLVSVSYATGMQIESITVVQPRVEAAMQAYGRWLAEGSEDAPALLRMIIDAIETRDHNGGVV